MGSVNYHPQEMATRAMFEREPWEVWQWYLYRLSVYRHAGPNRGHLALVELEQCYQERFTLVTQNVDNLHLLAGNSPGRTYQIHGNIRFMRCFEECNRKVLPLPDPLLPRQRQQQLQSGEQLLLSCADCGALMRPHVLWFDECYDEEYYHYHSCLAAAASTDVLVIAGTSGVTTLPRLIAGTVYDKHGTIIDINIEMSPFSRLAEDTPGGGFMQTTCSEGLETLLKTLK